MNARAPRLLRAVWGSTGHGHRRLHSDRQQRLIFETAPQYMPSFDLNKEIVQKAEKYDVDFTLSMIKLRGVGGKTQFWEHNLESFTLMAGLAAVTNKIKIFATAATLTLPPAIVARMAATIDSIAHIGKR